MLGETTCPGLFESGVAALVCRLEDRPSLLPGVGEDRASLSEDLAPDELTETRAEELLDAPSDDRVLGQDPKSGLDVWVRAGRFGPYVQLGEVADGQPKPKTASLFSTMTQSIPRIACFRFRGPQEPRFTY